MLDGFSNDDDDDDDDDVDEDGEDNDDDDTADWCLQKVQHVKLARERALSAEESDNSDVDDHTNNAGCYDNGKVSLMSVMFRYACNRFLLFRLGF